MLHSKILDIEGGDICLDVSRAQLISDGLELGDSIDIDVGSCHLRNVPLHSGPYCKMFGTVLIAGKKSTHLSIRRGKATEQYPVKVGQVARISLRESRRFWEKENAYSFSEIKVRLPQQGIESFANFRPLFRGGKMFFRSSSPFDDAYGRAAAVNSCIEKYGIKTIIDMADSEKEFTDLFKSLEPSARKQLSRYQIFPIGDDSGLYSKEFESSIILAIKIVAQMDGPFLIHCRAGKRRSGFICAIFQGLAGLSSDEIKAEYMLSYKNNNGVLRAENPARYDYLCADTIGKILRHINGNDLGNLPITTARYLVGIGIPYSIISKIKSKLINDKGPQ